MYGWGVFGNNGAASPVVNTPTRILGIKGKITHIATSNSDSYALTSDGEVWAWGVGHEGQLGDGGISDSFTSPVQVHFPSGVRIASLANPMPFDSAIDTLGRPWGWGLNSQGEFCLGAPTEQPLPVLLPLPRVTLATGAGYHALYYSGKALYACGYNQSGELGDGTFATTMRPTLVRGLPDESIISLTSSYEGSGALESDGTYYDWGLNNNGQLGDGTKSNSAVPRAVSLPASVRNVSQGGNDSADGQTLAILSNGTVWAWGSGNFGQLGNGDRTNSSQPVPVDVPSGVVWTSVASGGFSCYALGSDGALWAWGGDYAGQLGNGRTGAAKALPKLIGSVTGLTQISSTSQNVAAYSA
jgi:alpha-tubulin suppressor-like RCC1 family protein